VILRPFFSYYGSKWRIAKRYPAPKHEPIIEPFAGSAGYSLRYPEKKVLLIDADPVIVGVWQFIISSSAADILNLPLLEPGQTVDDLRVCQEAKWLIGFWLNRGTTTPCRRMSSWGCDSEAIVVHHLEGCFWGERSKTRIARQTNAVKHWEVRCGDYSTAPDTEATWFVDPPYQCGGHKYRKSDIDRKALAVWARARRGDVIVCEQAGATWLPFQPLVKAHTMPGKVRRGTTEEVFWLNNCACAQRGLQ
jgi:hypothetical protein